MSARIPARTEGDDHGMDHQSKKRLAELGAAYRKRDVVSMLSMISSEELDGNGAPNAPDPKDGSLSKRQWQLSMQVWKAAVKNYIQ